MSGGCPPFGSTQKARLPLGVAFPRLPSQLAPPEPPPVDPESPHARAQGVRIDPEGNRSPEGTLDSAAAPAQRRLDLLRAIARRSRGSGARAGAWDNPERRRDLQRLAVAQDRGSLDDRSKLAHVARPLVCSQEQHVSWCRRERPTEEAKSGARREMLSHRGDVPPSVPERGEDDREHADAVPEVLPETSLADQPRHVTVRGCDDAHVHGVGVLPTDALEAAILQHPEQPDLRGRRQFGDLVEEERAAVRTLEPALPLCDGPP